MKNKKPRVLYLSHGAGPMSLLGDEGHQEMVENLKVIVTKIKKPSAIIAISAHWEEKNTHYYFWCNALTYLRLLRVSRKILQY